MSVPELDMVMLNVALENVLNSDIPPTNINYGQFGHRKDKTMINSKNDTMQDIIDRMKEVQKTMKKIQEIINEPAIIVDDQTIKWQLINCRYM